jgi:hypothetical protein
MATFSDLPIELVVQVMIQQAIPQGYHSAYARDPDTTWETHSGSIRDAYNLAITNKKHYSAFKDQQRQIFSAVIKELLFPTEGRYNLTLQHGDIRVDSNEPKPEPEPESSHEPTKVTIDVDYNGAQEKCYASLIKYFQGTNIHHLVCRRLARPKVPRWGYMMHAWDEYVFMGKELFRVETIGTLDNPQSLVMSTYLAQGGYEYPCANCNSLSRYRGVCILRDYHSYCFPRMFVNHVFSCFHTPPK